MNDHIRQKVNKYRRRGIFLDTVLFVLLTIGTHNRSLVGRDKRLSQYAPEDLDTLLAFIAYFKKVVTTPNVITEVSNLTGHLFTVDFQNEFGKQIELMEEYYVPSKIICNSELFSRVGITDTAIAHISQNRFLVLTDDLRLVGQLEKRDIDVINFNHVRVSNWK